MDNLQIHSSVVNAAMVFWNGESIGMLAIHAALKADRFAECGRAGRPSVPCFCAHREGNGRQPSGLGAGPFPVSSDRHPGGPRSPGGSCPGYGVSP